jgi:uncharacterized protein YyaL (SSP411 family)
VLGAPHAYSMFLSGLDFAFGPSTEVVLTGEAEKLAEIIEVFSGKYLPNTVTHVWSSELAESIPYLAELKQTKTPMIYVCKDFVCNLPTNDIEKALRRIEEK